MEYCKNCGKPITRKIYADYHINPVTGMIHSKYCYTADPSFVDLSMIATPKTKHDKIKEILDDL